MKTKKGILIDVVNKTVTEVEIKSSKTLKEMYRVIGCSMVECVNIDPKNDLWVDEEGLLTVTENTRSFNCGGHYLIGNGLILGFNPKKGESCDTTLTVNQVKEMVKFIDEVDTRKILMEM